VSCELQKYFVLDAALTESKHQYANKGRDSLVRFNRCPPTRTLQYFSEAITAFVLYEYLLTLPDEVS
jgi:hypothetical protein